MDYESTLLSTRLGGRAHLNVMHAPATFQKYIPYGLGVMAQTQFTIWN